VLPAAEAGLVATPVRAPRRSRLAESSSLSLSLPGRVRSRGDVGAPGRARGDGGAKGSLGAEAALVGRGLAVYEPRLGGALAAPVFVAPGTAQLCTTKPESRSLVRESGRAMGVGWCWGGRGESAMG
jgi:hypothetical protein